jgi:bacillithiol biosynthesis cysteine-adding enzyme BshC
MLFSAHVVPYQQTGFYTPIVLDYLKQSTTIQPFFSFTPTVDGIKEAIEQKKNQAVDRKLLVEVLQQQYAPLSKTEAVSNNLNLLQQDNTFTITTAHQPNLFTGPLYFMYKILHAIKLAGHLQEVLPQYNFVPVYYMGSEDADFNELNHTYIRGKKIEWKKAQTGAVGRMKVDHTLIELIDEIQSQLYFEQHASTVIDLLKRCYTEGKDIQTATLELVNELYGAYGLIVLIPDNPALKKQMLTVFKNDLFQQTSSSIVAATSDAIAQHYKVQAHPREINLFYLKDNIRERIEQAGDTYKVVNTSISFSADEIENELTAHPERFSPNVILRGLFQETILPNIAFIGGGGELAYWLQLKELFNHYNIVYPVLVLRNSFLIISKEEQALMEKLQLSNEDIFKPAFDLLNELIERSGRRPKLNGELTRIVEVYAELDRAVADIDQTLVQHVAALKAKTVKQLAELEKKMLRAERKKQGAAQAKIERIKSSLFPGNGLQERVENFSSFQAKWGTAFIEEILNHSLSLEQTFMLLKEA